MKKKQLTPFLALFLLSSCSSPARVVDKNAYRAKAEPEPITQTQTTPTTSASVTPSIPLHTYDINSLIASQITGEIKETFEYLVNHLKDTTAQLENICHGAFTQNRKGELLVVYSIKNAPKEHGLDPTFLFILDVTTGELQSATYITADQVEIFLLPSPMSTKVFVTQNSISNGISYSNATLYSCLDGNWTPSSAVAEHTTVMSDGFLTSDYIYTYNGETLTVESQQFPLDDTEALSYADSLELSKPMETTLHLSGTYTWNETLSIFLNTNP